MVNMLDMLDALIMHSTWNRFVRLLSVIDIAGYIFQEIAYAYIRIYFRKLHMLIQDIYFRRLHMLISGYISGDCICLYQDIFQEIAYAYFRIYFRRLHMLI